MTSQIHGIFPTPVYLNKIDRKFTKPELNFINKQIDKCRKNAGNIHTKDNYIFKNSTALKNLETFINECIKDYFDKIIKTSNNVTPYITQSWLNYTRNNEFHHLHAHSNSFLSGVLYINADKKTDGIKFWNKEQVPVIKLETKEYTLLNSGTWKFPVETGDLILFPSTVNHSVDTVESKNMRISLAFNVFLKGTIGSNIHLTELLLP